MEVRKKRYGTLGLIFTLSLGGALLYFLFQTQPTATTTAVRGLTKQVLHVRPTDNGLGSVSFDAYPPQDPRTSQAFEQAGSNLQSPLAFQ